MTSNETIFALATPPGRSGVAVMRLSGPRSAAALTALGATLPVPRMATLTTLRHPSTGETVDRALLLYFPAPHSFTGEDVVEFHLHGSRAVIAEILGVLETISGLRPANPGEFSRRAFENGKLDLAEAEGLADLIDAETAAQKKQAMRQMEGALSHVAERLREKLMHGLACLEACIDFPDEEIPEETYRVIDESLSDVLDEIRRWLASADVGERVREGFHVTLLGVPNAGKSTLLNALAKRNIAIVSDEPGTTRDLLEARLDIRGLPVILTDTAGLRETGNAIEQEGIRRALAQAEMADLRVLLLDPMVPVPAQEMILEQFRDGDLILMGKRDLLQKEWKGAVSISARTGEGLDILIDAIHKRLDLQGMKEAPLLTRSRHKAAFVKAAAWIEQALKEPKIEIKTTQIREAIHSLITILGRFEIEELLDIVFANFCLGK